MRFDVSLMIMLFSSQYNLRICSFKITRVLSTFVSFARKRLYIDVFSTSFILRQLRRKGRSSRGSTGINGNTELLDIFTHLRCVSPPGDYLAY